MSSNVATANLITYIVSRRGASVLSEEYSRDEYLETVPLRTFQPLFTPSQPNPNFRWPVCQHYWRLQPLPASQSLFSVHLNGYSKSSYERLPTNQWNIHPLAHRIPIITTFSSSRLETKLMGFGAQRNISSVATVQHEMSVYPLALFPEKRPEMGSYSRYIIYRWISNVCMEEHFVNTNP